MKIIKILLPIALFFTAASPVKAETQLFVEENGNLIMSCIKHTQNTICQIQKVETKEKLLTINLTDQELTRHNSSYCFEQAANDRVLTVCYDYFPMPTTVAMSIRNLANGQLSPPLVFSAMD